MSLQKSLFSTRRTSILAFCVLTLFILTLTLWSVVFFRTQGGELKVTFLDVGQGDAIFIETPGGTQILIDGGRNQKVLRELSQVMPFWDRTIDIVVATHPDADHIGGLVDVFKRFKVSNIIETSVKNNTPTYRAYAEESKKENAHMVDPMRGTRIIVDGTAVFTVLSQEVVAVSNGNDASIVLRLDYGDNSFLFTGDASKFVEKDLLQYYDALNTDVLKVGHHGSSTSTSPEFVSATSPTFAVISVGKDNSYGHPTKQTLDTLEQAGVKVYRTDLDGTVRFVSNGEILRKKDLGFFERMFGI